MHMNRVSVAQMRQHLSQRRERVRRGKRLVVKKHSRPVAELGSPAATGTVPDRPIVEGPVVRPPRRRLPDPLEGPGSPYALSRALEEVRQERRVMSFLSGEAVGRTESHGGRGKAAQETGRAAGSDDKL